LFTDAAFIHGAYRVGVVSPSFGARLIPCPPWVKSQQVAEFFGLCAATPLAWRLCLVPFLLLGDNLSSLYCIPKPRPLKGIVPPS
jgi:hypothetical protein